MKRKMRSLLSLALALVLAAALTLPASAMRIENNVTALNAHRQLANNNNAGTSAEKLDSTYHLNRENLMSRGMAAKMISNVVLGTEGAENLSTPKTAPFDDVPADDPNAKYIAYCKQEGIIAGYGNGSFGPEDSVTGTAYVKMLLVGLGYDPNMEGFVGTNWSINVAQTALAAGLVTLVDDGGDVSSARDDTFDFFYQLISDSADLNGNVTVDDAVGMLLTAATLPSVEYDNSATAADGDGETPVTGTAPDTGDTSDTGDTGDTGDTSDGGTTAAQPTVSYRFELIPSGGTTAESGDGETTPGGFGEPRAQVADGLILKITTALPAEVLNAPSVSGLARYVSSDEGESLPVGKVVGFNLNNSSQSLYLSEGELTTLLDILEDITAAELAEFLELFGSTATYPDGTTTAYDPTDVLADLTPDQGLVDALSDAVGTVLTQSVQVGANTYDPVTGSIDNANLSAQEWGRPDGVEWSYSTTVSTRAYMDSRFFDTSRALQTGYNLGRYGGEPLDANTRTSFVGVVLDYGFDYSSGTETVDPFGRPSHTWTLAGTHIDTYADIPIAEYTAPVTYAELYKDVKGTVTSVNYYVDGVLTEGIITPELISSGNNATIPSTGYGVLTEVYAEPAADGGIALTVVSINTCLAAFDRFDTVDGDNSAMLTVYLDGEETDLIVSSRTDPDLFEAVSGCSIGDKLLVTLTRDAGGRIAALQSLTPIEPVPMDAGENTGEQVILDGESFRFSHNAVNTETREGFEHKVCFDAYGNVIDLEPVVELTMQHLAFASVSEKNGVITLSGRRITDDDLELKKDGETITLKDTYTAYPWESGIEVPGSCSVAPTAPAAIVETPVLDEDGEPLVDENGEPLTELTLKPLGEVDASPIAVDLLTFHDEHPNEAGRIYVATLYCDKDGNVAALTLYEQPIAYPLTGSSDESSVVTLPDDVCCLDENDHEYCDCTCMERDEISEPEYCGHETCWCYYEIGPGAWRPE